MLDQSTLHWHFRYEAETGLLFWKNIHPQSRHVNIGDVAGSVHKTFKDNTSYVNVKLYNKSYKAHRIIWVMNYGKINGVIDHIDRNGLNNRLDNLRIVDRSKNAMNSKIWKTNTSGVKGVHFQRKTGKWVARICVNYKRIVLGSYDTIEEATEARQKVESRHK